MSTKNISNQIEFTRLKPLYLVLFFTLFILGNCLGQNTDESFEKDTLDYEWHRFSVKFGGFISGLSSDLQVGSESLGLGLIVNIEDALGLKSSSTVMRGGLDYNYGKKAQHSARFGYIGFFRNSTKTLETELELGNVVFPIGTKVESTFDFQIFKIAYGYSFYQDKRIKLGASLGLFVMPIKFTASASNSSGVLTNFVAPLPVLGIGASFAITPKLHLNQSLEFLYIELSGLKGTISDVTISLDYKPWKHIGFGLGYNSFQMSISNEKDTHTSLDFVGSIKTGFSGLLLYGRYFF